MHGRYDVASSPAIFGSLLVSALNDLVCPLELSLAHRRIGSEVDSSVSQQLIIFSFHFLFLCYVIAKPPPPVSSDIRALSEDRSLSVFEYY